MEDRRKNRILCFVIACLLLLTGCGAPVAGTAADTASDSQPRGKVYFSYFDTASYVYSYAGDSEELFEQRAAAVSSLLGEYHQRFDIYHEYTDINNLCTVNLSAGKEPVKVDRETIEFLKYAVDLYYLTDGEMNIMLGSVLSIWHDYRTEALDNPSEAKVPDEELLKEAAKHTDIGLLEIDEEECTVRIADSAASIDVGALGKGYATEKAAQLLMKMNARSYVLNVGGNIRIIGTKPDGSSWTTGIKNPNDPQGEFAMKISIADTACVTSGCYERFYTVNGVRYHHIIDKDTLYPADYFSSVTIITPDSGLADALSTALFCMTYEDGLKLAEKIGNVEVIWIFRDGTKKYTDGIEDLICE